MSGRSVVLLAAAVVAICLAPEATADVKAFNAAVKAGDYKTAATEAETTWKTWDTNDEQTALLAREFGFAALVAGRNDLARQFGRFLMEKGAGLPTPDDQPLTSSVLFRAADFRLDGNDGRRAALREALMARSNAAGVDMTSVLAWELLYVADWNDGDFDNATVDATAAGEFFGRAATLKPRQFAAEVQAGSADFIRGRNRVTKGKNDYYDRMADVHDRIVASIDEAPNQAARDQLWPLKWKADAWAIAIAAYLETTYDQVGSTISTALKPRDLAQPRMAPYSVSAAEANVPVCPGGFEGPRPRYPESKRFRGAGSMIARIETSGSGKVVNVEILAAVPNEEFVENVTKTIKEWTYKPADGASNCRLQLHNYIYKASFLLGR